MAAVGSAAFFALAPGTVAGLMPWWLTRWQVRRPWPHWLPLTVIGVALIAVGTAVLVHAFAKFVSEGAGTPAPVAAPEHLVVRGLYRHVRNPMYLAILAIIGGQALVFGNATLLLYAAGVFAAFAAFVHFYEEPSLARRFGAQYEAYRRAVPAWWPRIRPYTPEELEQT